MLWNESIKALITALGIGLMIGVIRERTTDPETSKAGTRTHALLALLGSLTWSLGLIPFITTLSIIGALTTVSYIKSAQKDPGLTGEVAIILTFILAAMAQVNLALTAALAVLCAILLKAKSPIQKLSRDIINEQELSEALLILAAALIVMPLLPSGPIDPWGVIELTNIWRIVVLIMAMGMLGNLAGRALGVKLGLPIAGFFSGFASSTAAIASLGQRVKENDGLTYPAVVSALLANLSSLLLFAGIIGTISPDLLKALTMPLFSAVLSLLAMVSFILFFHKQQSGIIKQNSSRSFKLTHALIIALAISAISLISFWMNKFFGETGVLIASTLAGLTEVHAAAASLGQLVSTSEINVYTAKWGAIAVLGSSSVAKIILSFFSGGKIFGKLVSTGLVIMMLSLVGAIILS